jgi:hypothetical protein
VDTPNVHVELVHDPHRHRAVIGWSADPDLIRATALKLVDEAEVRAAQFEGLDDVAAATERSEASRLRRVIGLVLRERPRGGGVG